MFKKKSIKKNFNNILGDKKHFLIILNHRFIM